MFKLNSRRHTLRNPRAWLQLTAVCLATFFASAKEPKTSQTERIDSLPVIRDDFNTLKDWSAVTFEDVPRHSEYSIVKEDGDSYLKAITDNSASGIAWEREFDVYKYPRLRWRWKISNIYREGDATRKKVMITQIAYM